MREGKREREREWHTDRKMQSERKRSLEAN